MRVLFVAPYAPSRIRVRAYGFVRHLAPYHDVTVLALGGGHAAPAEADVDDLREAGVHVTVIEEPRHEPLLRTLKSGLALAAAKQPLQVAFSASPRLRAAIATELRAKPYDVLHVEHIRGLGALPAALDVPVVWDAVDCVSLLFQDGARAAATRMLRVVGPLEARLLRAFEGQQIQRFRHVLVTSERDKRALLALTSDFGDACDEACTELMDERITVLPHGLDRHDFRPYRGARQPRDLIFSGKMNYHANVAGAEMLVEHILPLVWREHPDVRLTIAGANPSAAVRRLARDPRIIVTGYVPDLRPLISEAQVSVSPLPYAVGIQNKVLEAMALGTPVVASRSAACGLQAVAGRDLLVADTPEEFAAAVCRVLGKPALWQRLAERGVRYIAAHHDWPSIIGRLTAVYTRARAEAASRPVSEPVAVSRNPRHSRAIPQPARRDPAGVPVRASGWREAST